MWGFLISPSFSQKKVFLFCEKEEVPPIYLFILMTSLTLIPHHEKRKKMDVSQDKI
jgi:hypothetical protein